MSKIKDMIIKQEEEFPNTIQYADDDIETNKMFVKHFKQQKLQQAGENHLKTLLSWLKEMDS